MRTLLLLVCFALMPLTAGAQTWVNVDFQDALPWTMTWTHGSGGSRDLAIHPSQSATSPSPCALNRPWTYRRVAPGSGNGGYNSRGYLEWRWCDYDVSRSGDQSEMAGWGGQGYLIEPGGSQQRDRNNWPDAYFARMRIYIDSPIIPHSTGDTYRQFKFFLWHAGVYDGDQRVIGFLEGGRNCGQSDATHVCFTLQRNISHWTDSATVALSVDTWHNLQWSWRHGQPGVSSVRIWRNNNNQSSPTAQDLNLTSTPNQPGGTSTWVKDNAGYDDAFLLANAANSGTRVDQDFVVRLSDFQLGGSFDPYWASSTTQTSNPTAPSNLRIVQQ